MFTSIADIEVDLDSEILPSGYTSIDRMAWFQRKQGDLVILGARPGHGKTTIALNIAQNIAQKGTVLFFEVEMAKEVLKKRLLAGAAKCAVKKLKYLPKDRLQKATQKLSECRILLDDTDGLTVDDLCDRAIDFYTQHGDIDFIVVDYIQILGSGREVPKKQAIAYSLKRLKGLANKLGCPVLVLAQVGRDWERRLRDNPMSDPEMSDFSDAADIEHWADVGIVLHRDKSDETVGKFYTVKHRHEDKHIIKLKYSGAEYKFYDMEQSDVHDVI